MPSLKEFSDATGLPRKRRWKDAYAEIRELLGQGSEPPLEEPTPEPKSDTRTVFTEPITLAKFSDQTGLPLQESWPDLFKSVNKLTWYTAPKVASMPPAPTESPTVAQFIEQTLYDQIPVYRRVGGPTYYPADPHKTWEDIFETVRWKIAADKWGKQSHDRSPTRYSNIAQGVEEVAKYLAGGFHEWSMAYDHAGDYYHEVGIHQYFDDNGKPQPKGYAYGWFHEGKRKRDLTVNYAGLRDDWETDEFKHVLENLSKLGFSFEKVDWPAHSPNGGNVADILVDDEKAGSSNFKNFATALDGRWQRYFERPDGRAVPVVHTTLNKVNVSKKWRDRSVVYALTHEMLHALGLGHPGPYPQYEGLTPLPHLFIFDHDWSEYTIMSYRGNQTEAEPGPADKLAVEMIYGS